MSVATTSAVQAAFCATIVDELTRAGLTDVVVCPGSRSTPLALALAKSERLRLHVRIDERSAAFFALGRALATGRPVAILVTSGTAAAELHAAVAEADLAGVPLILLTADRPPELRGVGAAQTIDQQHLYGAMVRGYFEPGVARDDARSSWRPLASRVYRTAAGRDGGRPGPVHVNLAFIEPLLAEPDQIPAGREDGETWTYAPVLPPLRSAIDIATKKVLCVVGAGVSAAVVRELWSLDWVVIGDATVAHTLPYADPLLRDDTVAASLAPDVVIRLGGLPASKVLAQRLRSWPARVIAYTGAGFVADPDGLVSDRLPGLPDLRATTLRGSSEYVQQWAQASRTVGEHLQELDAGPLTEIAAARIAVEQSVTTGASLVIGSSMPVRDVEWWTPSRVAPTFSNRGANGIDGVLSTALGVATGGRAIALVGDVTFLHDVSALVDGVDADTTAVIVVLDNFGGGIFNFLPQATAVAGEEFEWLFTTPRPHHAATIATAFGHRGVTVGTVSELSSALGEGLGQPGITVIVATMPPREENVALHQELVEKVPTWLSH